MVLSASRHMFVWPGFKMDQARVDRAHVEAFAFFVVAQDAWSRTTPRPG
jgi:hypothetical protein